MTTPVHPEKVADWFLSLHHYWFDESLGPNTFTGMREEARQYLYVWVETGEFAPDKTTLEIYVRMKFEEWLESSWVSKSPVNAHSALVEALKGLREATNDHDCRHEPCPQCTALDAADKAIALAESLTPQD